jgi:hypothetical protein
VLLYLSFWTTDLSSCVCCGRISGSRLHNLKELRPGSAGATEVRILFIFDPIRNAVLLIAGDKSGHWQEWYREAIPAAETAYEKYLKQLGGRP